MPTVSWVSPAAVRRLARTSPSRVRVSDRGRRSRRCVRSSHFGLFFQCHRAKLAEAGAVVLVVPVRWLALTVPAAGALKVFDSTLKAKRADGKARHARFRRDVQGFEQARRAFEHGGTNPRSPHAPSYIGYHSTTRQTEARPMTKRPKPIDAAAAEQFGRCINQH